MSVRTVQPGRWAPARPFFAHLAEVISSLLPANDSRLAYPPRALCHYCGEPAWTRDIFRVPLCRRCGSF